MRRREFIKVGAVATVGGIAASGCARVSGDSVTAAIDPEVGLTRMAQRRQAEGAARVFFGDLHNHTNLSDGQTNPDWLMRQAVGRMDFFAYTDHSQMPRPKWMGEGEGNSDQWHDGNEKMKERWGEIQELIRTFHEPGKFVTFLGQEWTSIHSGDHNIYYLRDDEPLRFAYTLDELYRELEGVEMMVFPHHPAYPRDHRGAKWEELNTAMAPVIEIKSGHGCAETDDGPWPYAWTMGPRMKAGTARACLDMGHKVGFIASTDNHGNTPGRYDAGMAAVWSPELTREALWDSIWKRRTYAISGDRILLDFRLNGQPMGSVVGGASLDPRRLEVEIDGWDRFEQIDVIRNGEVAHTWFDFAAAGAAHGNRYKIPVAWAIPGKDIEWSIEIEHGEALGFNPHYDGKYFYLLKQTSPHRLDAVKAQDGRAEGAFGVEHAALDVRGGPETRIRMVYREDVVLEGSIGELLGSDRIEMPFGAFKGYFHVGRIIPETEFHLYLEWEDTPSDSPSDYYYIRAMQRNRQMAWSSPIWVEPASLTNILNT